jgi:hypothetical protein
MDEEISHEDLVRAGEERMAEFNRTAPRCRYCTTASAWDVLNGLCPTCAFRVTVNWKGDNR